LSEERRKGLGTEGLLVPSKLLQKKKKEKESVEGGRKGETGSSRNPSSCKPNQSKIREKISPGCGGTKRGSLERKNLSNRKKKGDRWEKKKTSILNL